MLEIQKPTSTILRVILICASLLMMIAQAGYASAQTNSRRQEEQTHFGAEEKVKRPVTIPEAVLKVLQSDERNQTCLKGEPVDKMPATWFAASEIHLSQGRSADLIVTA